MPTSIKITALGEIASANIFGNMLLPVVRTDGGNTTYKSTLGNLANVVLGNATGATFNRAASANTALTVINAAQANITSVGTLTSLSVTGTTTSGNFTGIFSNSTSNISIPVAAGNILMTVGGIANVLIITTTGANIAGNVSGNNVVATLMVKTTPTTLGSLPAAGTAGAGARAFITDANLTMVAANIGATVGSGAPNADIPIYSDGANWCVG